MPPVHQEMDLVYLSVNLRTLLCRVCKSIFLILEMGVDTHHHTPKSGFSRGTLSFYECQAQKCKLWQKCITIEKILRVAKVFLALG